MEKRAKLAAHWHAISDRDILMAIILILFYSIQRCNGLPRRR